MNYIWYEEGKIKDYEVDYKNKLKVNHLFNYMQEAAGNHASHLGVGYDDLTASHLFWILSRVKVQMNRYPEMGDKLRLETWPKSINRLYASRDFIFSNEAGEIYGTATTLWLLLDAKTMRPQRIQALPAALPENKDRHGLDEELDKLNCSGALVSAVERTAAYSDIDINKHVNNAKYVEWLLDCFSNEVFSSRQIKSLQVNFLAEAKYGDTVMLQKVMDQQTPGNFYIEGIHKETQKKIFQSKIEWI